MQVDIVGSGDAAIKAVAEQPPDLVILDLNLPVLSGFDVCRILRAKPATAQVPIIMLTARTTEVDRVSGLDLGADDYVTKPFSLRELAARVRAVLRRPSSARRAGGHLVYRGTHLIADFDAVSIQVDGQSVRLTRREFELLPCLVENRNRVLSRDRLLERVWGYDRFIETRSVDVHVGRLRAKLDAAGAQIETVVGLGYRFVELGPAGLECRRRVAAAERAGTERRRTRSRRRRTPTPGIVRIHAQTICPRHAPPHRRQPARRADADDRAGDRVRGADADAEQRRHEDGDRGAGLRREPADGRQLRDLRAHRLDDAPAARERAEADGRMRGKDHPERHVEGVESSRR